MHAWEFAKALHLQREHGWARFVSMQDHYNLLAREEEREMLPLCADEGVGTIVVEPARPRPARRARRRREADARVGDRRRVRRPALQPATDAATARSSTPSATSPRAAASAAPRSRWPGCARNPVVTAPLVGANTTAQIDDAVASLDIDLTDDEIARLEAPYTPRYDFQGISDDAELQQIMARIPQFTTAS